VTVATCDTMVEGVHFERAWLDPEDVGWRAVALATGDLAAKGATPTYGLVSLSLPALGWTQEDVVGLYRGMAQLAGRIGLKLVGGDTSSTPIAASIQLTLLGKATAEVVPRSAAKPGWLVAVTGPLGAAGAGLRELTHGEPCPPDWEAALRRPMPRLDDGRQLAAAGVCCGDVSDGLIREMEKFMAAAGTGCRIRLDDVPCASGVPPALALTSGEETELVCVAPESAIRAAAETLERELFVVGELTAELHVAVLDAAGQELQFQDRGHEHFA
jgi:thiamine-monophosphate kinase